MDTAAPIAKQRKDWIDFGRGLLMFLVFVYHSEVYYSDHHSWSWLFSYFFLTGFFFLSGYLFTSNLAKTDLRSKTKQVIRSIVVPYFLFMFLFIGPKTVLLKQDIVHSMMEIVTFRASWFIVAIGSLQLIFALLLHFFKSAKAVALASMVMGICGCIIVSRTQERLPLSISHTLITAPYFGLGILYRKYEHYFEKWISVRSFLVLAVFYLAAIVVDRNTFDSGICMAVNAYRNFPLVMLYALTGIAAIVAFSKIVGSWRPLNYVGAHSLLFYFLNAICLRIVIFAARLVGIPAGGGGYAGIIGIAVCACLLACPLVRFINAHLPVLAGRKEIFNRISRKLHLNITW